MEALVVGIDIGTGGVRVAAYDAAGRLHAEASEPLTSVRDGDHFEQDPAAWWQGAAAGLRAVVAATAEHARIVALSVAATSGTICLLDAAGNAVRPALMYADRRSEPQSQQINGATTSLRTRFGYSFNSSWGLPKIAWLAQHEPNALARASACRSRGRCSHRSSHRTLRPDRHHTGAQDGLRPARRTLAFGHRGAWITARKISAGRAIGRTARHHHARRCSRNWP